MTGDGFLAGLRVLDLADATGAFAGRLLARLGADVVLAESPGGSPLRRVPPFWQGVADPERSLFFWFYAAGKRSCVVDPDTPDGTARLARLIASADVVIETGPPGRGPALAAAHPQLVVASITPFGQAGPYRDWRSSDTVAQAVGGMMGTNGRPDGPPLRSLGLQAYHQAGVLAASGAIAALLARDRSGRGQLVDVSLQAAVTGSLEHVPGQFHQSGVVPRRQGTLHWTRFFRVGRCRDGWVMHCTLGDWTSILEWVKSEGMATGIDDPRYEESPARQADAERLFDALDAWAALHTVDELHEGAQLRRIPYAAVRPPEALLEDAHLRERGFFVALDHPGLPREISFPDLPFGRSQVPPFHAHPPLLDEHRDDIESEWMPKRL